MEYLSRNHEPLNLRGTLVNLRNFGVAEVTLDFEVLSIAITAVNLDRLSGSLHCGFSGEQLCHRGLPGARLSGILDGRRPQGQQPRRVDLDRDVGELPLDRLVARERAAEGLPLLRILQRRLERGPPDPDRLRGDPDPPAVERFHRDLEAV